MDCRTSKIPKSQLLRSFGSIQEYLSSRWGSILLSTCATSFPNNEIDEQFPGRCSFEFLCWSHVLTWKSSKHISAIRIAFTWACVSVDLSEDTTRYPKMTRLHGIPSYRNSVRGAITFFFVIVDLKSSATEPRATRGNGLIKGFSRDDQDHQIHASDHFYWLLPSSGSCRQMMLQKSNLFRLRNWRELQYLENDFFLSWIGVRWW